MRFLKLFCAVGFLAGSSTSILASPPEVVAAPVHKVFAPIGFDDNDNSEIVVHGEFLNSCYKVGEAKAEVDARRKLITLSVTAYHYKDAVCANMLVPFIQTVKLGVLDPGEYQVVVAGRPDAQTSPLKVVHTESKNADEFLYAPVEQATLVQDYFSNQVFLELSGHYPHMLIGCMQIKDVQTEFVSGNVLIVRPTAEIREAGDCETRGQFKFRKEMTGVMPGEYLVHSRALAQGSVNSYSLIIDPQ